MPSYNVSTPPKKHPGRKRVILLSLLLLIILASGGVYWRLQIYKPASEIIKTAGTPSRAATPDVSANTPAPKKQPVSNTQRTIGGSTDTNGKASTTTPSSQWITSTSGNITVEQPLANTTVQSGSILSGTAKVSAVSFTLVDNQVGLISQGTLNVVNGKFSGNLNFTTHSSSGELNVYSTNDKGVEFNVIQIAVKF